MHIYIETKNKKKDGRSIFSPNQQRVQETKVQA